jgi:G2/mitotic-specific cyclin-B, other
LGEVDVVDGRNPQQVGDFAEEILKSCLSQEGQTQPASDYMAKTQKDIAEKMRQILVDWLVDVHYKFKLVPETLYLTVNLIDRYLEKKEVSRQNLQLVGVTAMLIASKFEEIYAPIVKDFVYITDNAYTKEEILQMEMQMLHTLDFEVNFTSSFRFLERFVKVAKVDPILVHLSRYFLELSLVNYHMLKYSQSLLASAALYLAMKMAKIQSPWSPRLVDHTSYKESEIRSCAKDLFLLFSNAKNSSTQAVRKKFSHSKFGEVAKIQVESQNHSQS